jgi:transposase
VDCWGTSAANRRSPRPSARSASPSKKTIHAAEQERADVAQRRQEWKGEQSSLNAGRLIFIDETWAKTNMTRLRGRAPRGERLVARVPHGHWKTTTLIAALGVEGVRCSMVVDGAIDRQFFDAFVQDILVHELRPGDIVVLDNLSSHKSERARRLIESCGATLAFLPPYSPDLNPIEMVFSKIKHEPPKAPSAGHVADSNQLMAPDARGLHRGQYCWRARARHGELRGFFQTRPRIRGDPGRAGGPGARMR